MWSLICSHCERLATWRNFLCTSCLTRPNFALIWVGTLVDIIWQYLPFLNCVKLYLDRLKAKRWNSMMGVKISHKKTAACLRTLRLRLVIVYSSSDCSCKKIIIAQLCYPQMINPRPGIFWYCSKYPPSKWLIEWGQASRDLWGEDSCCWLFDSPCYHIESKWHNGLGRDIGRPTAQFLLYELTNN